MNASVNPKFSSAPTPISSLAIAGEGATAAISAFIEKGYSVTDIGHANDPLRAAQEKEVPYLVTVDPVGTDGAWWDGIFDYSMRVTDTVTGGIVWTATAEYGSGVSVDQVTATKNAMHDMVEDFSQSFPPQ